MNDVNFDSYNTSYSVHKEDLGGKGLGRFLWLVSFEPHSSIPTTGRSRRQLIGAETPRRIGGPGPGRAVQEQCAANLTRFQSIRASLQSGCRDLFSEFDTP